MMSFEQWLNKYREEYQSVIERYRQKSHFKAIIPKGFSERILQQYIAYRTEMETKRLVWATWFLAFTTILLSLLTFIF